MNVFLAEHLDEKSGWLGAEDSHHAARVLRLSPKDEILTTRGEGVIYRSEIQEVSKTKVSFTNKEIFKKEERPRHLHIAIAPTKSNDRFEFFLEKATELGVAEITPIICNNSERKIYKTERGRKIMAAASKQSLRCWWPVLREAVSFSEFLKEDLAGEKCIAHCAEAAQTLEVLETSKVSKTQWKNLASTLPDAVVLIGPEGDFSDREIEAARAAGFREISLGENRLRTETAGMMVAGWF